MIYTNQKNLMTEIEAEAKVEAHQNPLSIYLR
jgi:hypothetical protein